MSVTTIRTVLVWHIGVLLCVGAAAAGTYHGLQQLHAQRTALGVQEAQATASPAAPAASTAPAPTVAPAAAAPAETADATPHAAVPSVGSPATKTKTAAALPPGFWFQPLPHEPAAGDHARTHVARTAGHRATGHTVSRTVLASSRHVVRPTPAVRQTVTAAAQPPRPPLPQPDPRVAYYGYPGYYPYAAGYRYYPYYPRYPYYSSY